MEMSIYDPMNRSAAKKLLGLDVGSTTVKAVITDQASHEIIYTSYKRHGAMQKQTVLDMLGVIAADERFASECFEIYVCGSGGRPISTMLKVPYVQEVVANAAAVAAKHNDVRTAIELGGQDAKVIFFSKDPASGELVPNDMRMNGSCAGGTGAFIDEIAALLRVDTEDFDDLAAKGSTVYDISGRCGVFAKTDIQPLLLQGAAREDIALSTFHAIARQTIGGLSQGLELKAPVIFEGGPLTFNSRLVDVFAGRLGLKEDEVIRPEHPETIVAFGAALAGHRIFGEKNGKVMSLEAAIETLSNVEAPEDAAGTVPSKRFFESDEEKEAFIRRHSASLPGCDDPDHVSRSATSMSKDVEPDLESVTEIGSLVTYRSGFEKILPVYIGIDSGSTTSKIVLLDEDEHVVDSYYASNYGKPLDVVCRGLLKMNESFRSRGITLECLGLGCTGYGEKMAAAAFGADHHMVETVAHAEACRKYVPDVSFILDIGGQDMKAIYVKDRVITNIMLNEACSSGCGSFLENFASSLNIPVDSIAGTAFDAAAPANLGSRCTVFMNSTIVTEQRNGKSADDLIAGLCRSIIENVFTKVVRISNTEELGDRIVVQGGTFRNFAVLRAIEEYLGREVTLAPYPGEMGAIGAALLTKRAMEEKRIEERSDKKPGRESFFIGFDAIERFSYTTESGVKCNGCGNACSRTVMTFSSGKNYITGNRCERGASDMTGVRQNEASDIAKNETNGTCKKEEAGRLPVNMFDLRTKYMLQEYPCRKLRPDTGMTVGIPRVLEFWDSLPFWTTFFRCLGYSIVVSSPNNRKQYEEGISYVASDTICFPAKIVHGAIMDLKSRGVDRIFFPYIMHMPPEGIDKLSPYVCSVVQGYPMVVKNSQDPAANGDVIYDNYIFHWFTEKDRKRQIIKYAEDELGADRKAAAAAFRYAEEAIQDFRKKLVSGGREIIRKAKESDSFAVVLAGRPYHTDPFVNHELPRMFTDRGISVLTVDSLPGLSDVDIANTRAEITNNFHTRMLEAAVSTGKESCLEYVQIVSFGCGHDAILSDEIIRDMELTCGKPPLILKLDESDAKGSLTIRVESFLESVKIRRKIGSGRFDVRELESAFPCKFYRDDKKKRTILIPNVSENVSILLSALLKKQGFIPKTLPTGEISQIKTGKKYSHNDICFPAQMVIGELIDELQKGGYDQDSVAVGMVKFQCDCRMSHYAGLLRKALDSAGFDRVPVVSTDFNDSKKSQPGVLLLGPRAMLDAAWIFIMADILTDLARKIRPYEINEGQTNRILKKCVEEIADAIQVSIVQARRTFGVCVNRMAKLPYDRSMLKPRVLVTGELLVTYHPGSNFHIEEYLEANGMETVFPRVTDQLRKDFLASLYEIKDFHATMIPYPYPVDAIIDHVHRRLEKIASSHPLYEEALRPRDSYEEVRDIIPMTLSCGEGWLMAAEIAHYAEKGVKSFVILQPFGCLPNHICGRGVIKALKDRYDGISILPLDLDPDTSYANVENRLQMLLMSNTDRQ